MPAPTSLGSVSEGMLGTQLDLQAIQGGQIKLQDEQINLARDKIALQQQVKMLSLMQNLKPPQEAGTPDGIAGVLNQISMIQLQSGMPDAAAKTAGEAARIQDVASKVDYRTYRMQNDRLSKFANVLSSVPDSQAGWTQAIQTMISEDPGVMRDQKFQSLARQPWRPGLVPTLQRSVLTAKDQAEVNYRRAAAGHAIAAEEVDEHRVKLIDAQTDLARAREDMIKKEGGLRVKSDDRKAIIEQAKRDYPAAVDEDIYARSRPLAEEMVKMMREQHLTQSQAAVRVYENAKSRGDFNGLRQAPVIKGAKPGAPLALPDKPEQVRQNQWYRSEVMFGDGEPRLAIGTKFYTEAELAEFDADERDALGLDDDEAAAR